MDILSKQLDLGATRNDFNTHPKCNNPLITHLSFADDVLIFFDGSQRSLGGIITILDNFERISGLALNLRKSCLFIDGNNLPKAKALADRFGLIQGSLHVRYLGLPLLPHKLRVQDYQSLIDRVNTRISSWTIKHLSFAGRLQLIQSVLFSIVNFWSSIFPLPKSCLERIEKICNAFLWSGNSNTARGAKVSWDSVCSPKKDGGLGLRKLQDSNQVYGLKLIWLMFASQGSLWVAWVLRHLIRGRLFWDVDFRNSGSWIWKRLMKLRPLARSFLHCRVVSGSSILFWHDNWTGLVPLIDIVGDNGPRVSGLPYLAPVKNCCNENGWLISAGRHPLLVLLRNCLVAPPPQLDSTLQDQFLWRNLLSDPPGIFSTTKMMRALHPPSLNPPVSWHKAVWFKKRIPRHAFLAWLVARGRLTTRDRLRSWGINVPSLCLLCGVSDETIDHLFFNCSYSSEVWYFFFSHSGLSPPSTLDLLFHWVLLPSPCVNQTIIIKLLFQAVMYSLWRERNSRLHNSSPKLVPAICKDVQKLIRAKLSSLDGDLRSSHTLTGPVAVSNSESHLYTWFRLFQA